MIKQILLIMIILILCSGISSARDKDTVSIPITIIDTNGINTDNTLGLVIDGETYYIKEYKTYYVDYEVDSDDVDFDSDIDDDINTIKFAMNEVLNSNDYDIDSTNIDGLLSSKLATYNMDMQNYIANTWIPKENEIEQYKTIIIDKDKEYTLLQNELDNTNEDLIQLNKDLDNSKQSESYANVISLISVLILIYFVLDHTGTLSKMGKKNKRM